MRIETNLSFRLDEYDKLPDSNENEKDIRNRALHAVRVASRPDVRCEILKKSVDARKKNDIRITFRVLVTDEPGAAEDVFPAPKDGPICESPRVSSAPAIRKDSRRPVVVGFGPAGMMAALLLAQKGLCPVIIERGCKVEQRTRDVEEYFISGKLDTHSNVQFGEGGAGTFSDGKLNTGVKDSRRAYVLNTFVDCGAPAEILYASKPHVGTDRLRGVVISLRNKILALGGTFLFERTVSRISTENGRLTGLFHAASKDRADESFLAADDVILAIGHSARDTFSSLLEMDVPMMAKPFSVGVRIEHPQEWIDRAQYGASAGHPALPPADYKLVSHTADGRALYTFCMCPGGFVVASASEEGHVVTNGMSNYLRSGENANSAILVGVDTRDFGADDVLAGVRFQEKLERLAFAAGGKSGRAPCQRLGDFLEDRESVSPGEVKPTYRPGVTWTNLRKVLPIFVSDTISEGIRGMDRALRGFSHPDSLITGVETRSSSPVRIMRDESLESPGIRGLYPCGEGAGYAGGIMSSAIDGLRCAEKVIEKCVK